MGKLALSSADKKLAGVCGGLAKYFDIDVTIVRVLMVLLSMGWGTGILLYIICWAVFPNSTE